MDTDVGSMTREVREPLIPYPDVVNIGLNEAINRPGRGGLYLLNRSSEMSGSCMMPGYREGPVMNPPA